MWLSRFLWREKKSEQTFFFLNHSALTGAPTENLYEYKIVERKMAHFFLNGQILPSFSGLALIRPAR